MGEIGSNKSQKLWQKGPEMQKEGEAGEAPFGSILKLENHATLCRIMQDHGSESPCVPPLRQAVAPKMCDAVHVTSYPPA